MKFILVVVAIFIFVCFAFLWSHGNPARPTGHPGASGDSGAVPFVAGGAAAADEDDEGTSAAADADGDGD